MKCNRHTALEYTPCAQGAVFFSSTSQSECYRLLGRHLYNAWTLGTAGSLSYVNKSAQSHLDVTCCPWYKRYHSADRIATQPPTVAVALLLHNPLQSNRDRRLILTIRAHCIPYSVRGLNRSSGGESGKIQGGLGDSRNHVLASSIRRRVRRAEKNVVFPFS